MHGKVRTREKCPRCGQKFTVTEEIDIRCTTCDTRPKTYFIWLYWQREKHRISRDRDGHILDSFRRAHRLLEKMRSEIDATTFLLQNYLPKEIEQYRGNVLFPKWLGILKSKGNALSYTRKIEQYIRDHFIPHFGSMIVTDIRTSHIEDFRTYLTMEYRIKLSGERLAPATIKKVLDVLKEFFHWLKNRETVVSIPFFASVDVPEHVIEVMHLDDREKVLKAVTSPYLKNILSFMKFHPVRSSEACALDVSHFDLKSGIVCIERSLDYDDSIKPRKSKQAYEIPISPEWDASCLRGRFGKEIAFPSKYGKRYNSNTANEGWKAACKRAGVPYLSLYPSMRHTTATSYADRNIPEEQIEAMLGQSTRGMSRKYVKKSVERLRHIVGDGAQVVHMNEKRADK